MAIKTFVTGLFLGLAKLYYFGDDDINWGSDMTGRLSMRVRWLLIRSFYTYLIIKLDTVAFTVVECPKQEMNNIEERNHQRWAPEARKWVGERRCGK